MNEIIRLSANLRIFHGGFETPEVSIYLNKEEIGNPISFRDLSHYISIIPGKYLLEVYDAQITQKLLLSKIIRVEAPLFYTLYLTDSADKDVMVEIVIDDPVLPIDETKLRVIHLSMAADIFDVAVKGRDVVFDNVFAGCSTAYLGLSPMTIDLEIRKSGSKSVITELPSLRFNSNVVYTLLIVGHPIYTTLLQTFLLMDCKNG